MDARTMSSPIHTLNYHPPYCVEVGASVSEAIDLMQEGRFGGILIVDKQKLVGIITERDLLVHLMGKQMNPSDVVVEDVMTPSPESLHASDPIAYALNIMHLGRYRHIPLLDDESGYPIGVVTSKDIVSHFAKFLDTHEEDWNHALQSNDRR